jgi:Beta-lactamase
MGDAPEGVFSRAWPTRADRWKWLPGYKLPWAAAPALASTPRRRTAAAGFTAPATTWRAGCHNIEDADGPLALSHAIYRQRQALQAAIGFDEAGPMAGLGLGWVSVAAQGIHPALLAKSGGGAGFMSYIAFAPGRDTGVFVAVNRVNFAMFSGLTEAANGLIAVSLNFLSLDFRLVVQSGIQQGTVDFDAAVVVHEAQFSKFVHEKTYAGLRSADHLRKRLPADFRDNRLGHEQEQPGKPFLTRIEQLIHEVCFDANGPAQKMGNEHLGERWFLMEHADNGRFFQSDDDGFRHCRDRRYPQSLSGQTSFTEEVVRSKNCDDGFLALLRNDGDLHLAFLDIEDRIRRVSLCKDDLVFAVRINAPAIANLGEKRLRIESRPVFDRHSTSLRTARLSTPPEPSLRLWSLIWFTHRLNAHEVAPERSPHRALTFKMGSSDRGSAQIQSVGACRNQESRLTFLKQLARENGYRIGF